MTGAPFSTGNVCRPIGVSSVASWRTGSRIDQLGDRDVQRGALDAVRILGRNAQALRRLARLDLGAVAAHAVVIALRQAADVGHEPLRRAVLRRQLDDHRILGATSSATTSVIEPRHRRSLNGRPITTHRRS